MGKAVSRFYDITKTEEDQQSEETILLPLKQYNVMLNEIEELRQLQKRILPSPISDVIDKEEGKLEFTKWKNSADPFAVVASSPHLTITPEGNDSLSSSVPSCAASDNSGSAEIQPLKRLSIRRASSLFNTTKQKISHVRSLPILNKKRRSASSIEGLNKLPFRSRSFFPNDDEESSDITEYEGRAIENESDLDEELCLCPLLTKWNAETYQKFVTISAIQLKEEIRITDKNNKITIGEKGDWIIYGENDSMQMMKNEEFLRNYRKIKGQKYLYQGVSKPLYAKKFSTKFAISKNEGTLRIKGKPQDWVVQEGNERTNQYIISNEDFIANYIRYDHPMVPFDVVSPSAAPENENLSLTTENVSERPAIDGYIEDQAMSYLKQYAGKREFDIFVFAQLSKAPLKMLGMYIFTQMNILHDLELSEETMSNYLYECGLSYLANPYHNVLHASDVLNATTSIIYRLEKEQKEQFRMSEFLALLIAAAIHDIGHPGTTNQFQVQSCSDLAIQYNDSSVLENYHCALGFCIMKQHHCAVLASLKMEDFQNIRKWIIQYVLATDLATSAERINSFGFISKRGYQPTNELDRRELLKLVMAAADVNHPSKERKQHLEWSERCLQEFADQVAKESALELPVSISLDLTIAGLAKSQIGFIKFIAMPIYASIGSVINLDPWMAAFSENMKEWQECLQRPDSNKEIPVIHNIFELTTTL